MMSKIQKKSKKQNVLDQNQKPLTVTLAEGCGRSVQEVEHLLERLKSEAQNVDGSAWTFAELAYQAKTEFGLKNKQIAEAVGYSEPPGPQTLTVRVALPPVSTSPSTTTSSKS